MPTLTIRRIPADLSERIKAFAARNNRSMERELRHLLRRTYPAKAEILAAAEARWDRWPAPTPEQVRTWIDGGRP